MTWHVLTIEADGDEAVSSDLGSERNAISFAADLIAAGIRVARIEGSAEVIGADEVLEAYAEHRRAPARVWPGLAEAESG